MVLSSLAFSKPTRPFPSAVLTFLNKACILSNSEKDVTPTGEAIDPWRLCTASKSKNSRANKSTPDGLQSSFLLPLTLTVTLIEFWNFLHSLLSSALPVVSAFSAISALPA
ncbi:hypothetical protein Tco_1007950, partial [Tanacetum coccineum]